MTSKIPETTRIIILLIAIAVLAGCSVYNPPYYLNGKNVQEISFYRTNPDKLLKKITDKDSMEAVVKYINFNEGFDGPVGEGYRLDIYTGAEDSLAAVDTISLNVSKDGAFFSVKYIRRNVYGKILSDKIEFFRFGKNILNILTGKKK